MNLHPVTNKHFINSLSAANIGAYIDTVNGNVKNLVIKDIGLTIPYISGSTTIETTSTTTGQVFAGILTVSQVAPCDECDSLEYYVGIRQDERIPGRNNSEAYPRLFPYGGKLLGSEMTITSGAISKANVMTIGADIVDQISSRSNSEWGPSVTAARAIQVTLVADNGNDVTFTGTPLGFSGTQTVTYNASKAQTTLDVITALNASGLVYAFLAAGTTQTIWVIPIGVNNGYWDDATAPLVFTSGDGTVTTFDAAGNAFIGIYGTNTEKGIKITLEENAQFTLTVLQNHEFPTLTSNDVFEEFMLDPNDGMLAQFRRGTVPTDTSWTRYVIQWQTAVPSLSEGAGHYNSMKHMLKLYVPSSEVASATHKWEKSNLMLQTGDTGFSGPDTDWSEVLAWWQNSAPTGSIVGQASILLATPATGNGVITVSINGGAYVWMFNVANLDAVDTTGAAMQAVIDATPGFASTTYTAGTDTLLIAGTVNITSCTVTSTCGTTGTVTIL